VAICQLLWWLCCSRGDITNTLWSPIITSFVTNTVFILISKLQFVRCVIYILNLVSGRTTRPTIYHICYRWTIPKHSHCYYQVIMHHHRYPQIRVNAKCVNKLIQLPYLGLPYLCVNYQFGGHFAPICPSTCSHQTTVLRDQQYYLGSYHFTILYGDNVTRTCSNWLSVPSTSIH
jgi:hypothetical protein